jgi:photosystem II stability/assembly factor-like uncharacterized protein
VWCGGCSGPAAAITSPDAVNWTLRAINFATGQGPTDVCAVDARFVAVGDLGWVGYSDDDGATWTATKIDAASPVFMGVAYNGRTVVVCGSPSGGVAAIYSSDDRGTTWTKRANPRNTNLRSVAALPGGRFFAVGDIGAGGKPYALIGAVDGATWGEYTYPYVNGGGLCVRARRIGRVLYVVGNRGALASIDWADGLR